jgi:hypothetical protein
MPPNASMKTIKSNQLARTLLALGLCLWGCASHVTKGNDFDSSTVDKIVNGKTTADELINLFGAPQEKRPETDNGERWIYYYEDLTTKAPLVIPFAPIRTRSTGYKKNLNLLIDKNRIVVNHTFDEGPVDEKMRVR